MEPDRYPAYRTLSNETVEDRMSTRSIRMLPAATLVLLLAGTAAAQQPAAPPPPAQPATKTMSQSLGIMVFPAKGQTAEQ